MTSALEDIKTIELDKWLTLSTAPSPTKLQPGQTPYAYNTWVDEKPGSVITANGFLKVGTLPSGNPGTFCINYFKTSAGTQTFVVSDNATVWTTTDFQNFTAIVTGLSVSFQLRGLVVRDKLWLTNGSDAVRTFDGTTVTVLDGSGSTPNVPRGRYIAYHDERVWLGHISSQRSQVYFSSLTDSSANIIDPDNASAWPSDDNLQISEGDADYLTGIIPYRGYLTFFKQYSIWRLVGYDEYSYSRVKTRASTGTRFNESLQVIDSLVHLIGIDGIYVFDGEETDRISDIIDPSTAEQTSFGFNQLQQPNTNNQFWEVSSTADWNAGKVPQNLGISNEAVLQAKDSIQSDFQAGPVQTNIDLTSNPDFIQLSPVASGGSTVNVSQGQVASLSSALGAPTIGTPSMITDGVLSGQKVGFQDFDTNVDFLFWNIDLGSAQNIGSATIRALTTSPVTLSSGKGPVNSSPRITSMQLQSSNDNSTWTTIHDFGISLIGASGPTDYSSGFSVTHARYWRLFVANAGNGGNYTIAELQLFAGGFNLTGQFVSRTLDLQDTPVSLGNFFSDYVLNGEGLSFQTQTSSDGSTWDGAISVSNGGAIGSTVRRYFRWIANFTSDGNNTPVISNVWVGTLYESAIHDTGGNIFTWGAFESDYTLNGQTINFYYRGATTSGGVSTSLWNLIVPGGALSIPASFRYIQFKFEISGLSSGNSPPVVDSVTINWVVGTGTQPQVLQNVASFFWRNRYWLSAAGEGATTNNLILIRGKKTFQSPWQLKDWNILSFCRYLDNFYGTSSVDGSIYQLDIGYSKNGFQLNSIFETGDFTFKGFQANIVEMLIETERLGPYTLFVGTSIDQGQTWTDHAIDLTLSSGDSFSFWEVIRNLNLTTDKLRLRFFTNQADQPWQVHNVIVYYKLSSQRGSIH